MAAIISAQFTVKHTQFRQITWIYCVRQTNN